MGYAFLEASAKAKIANFATNLGALTVFIPGGHVMWRDRPAVMAVANLVGGYAGARTAVARGGPVRAGRVRGRARRLHRSRIGADRPAPAAGRTSR